MSHVLLTNLKKKLPAKYASAIAAKSSQLSLRRIRAVFNGEVTDAEKVREVVLIARVIIKEQEALNRLLKGKKKTTHSKKVK